MRTMGPFQFSNYIDSKKITLKPLKGAIMLYGQVNPLVIEFPGEYDIQGNTITCYATGDVLHYIVTIDEKRYAIIQNVEVLTKESFDQIDVRVVFDSSIQDYIEKEELPGRIELVEI